MEESQNQEKTCTQQAAELSDLKKQLEQERAERKEIEAELSDLKQNSVPAQDLPEVADLYNQLKGERKKSKTELVDVELIVDMIRRKNERNY